MEDDECGVADKIPRLDEPIPALGVHTFKEKLLDSMVYFQVISMDGSFHLWVGNNPCKFGDMAVAMKTKFDKLPSSTSLLGGTDSPSIAMAQRLAKKTGKQVFVSCNLAFNQLMLPLVEKRVGEEMNTFPDKF